MSGPVASQEARETAEGAWVESGHGSVKRAILKRLEERYPDRHIPWGEYRKAAEGFDYAYFTQVARRAGYSYRDETHAERRPKGHARQYIENEIATKYPCMEIPRGLVNEWAKTLGITRQRVHQIVTHCGAKSYTKKARTCKDCDALPLPRSQRCAEHVTVRLTCESCGKEFYLRRAEVFARAKQSTDQALKPNVSPKGSGHTALSFCRKACRKERGMAYMRENPAIHPYFVAMKFGVTRGAAYQWAKAMRQEESKP